MTVDADDDLFPHGLGADLRSQPRDFGGDIALFVREEPARASVACYLRLALSEVGLQPGAGAWVVFWPRFATYMMNVQEPFVHAITAPAQLKKDLRDLGLGDCVFCRGFTSQMFAACSFCAAEESYRVCAARGCLTRLGEKICRDRDKCAANQQHRGAGCFSPNAVLCLGKQALTEKNMSLESKRELARRSLNAQRFLVGGLYAHQWSVPAALPVQEMCEGFFSRASE